MRTRVALSIAISALVVSNASIAGAQGTESSSAEIFKALDKNGDGTLTAVEVGEKRERFFNRLVRIGDSNKDGKLSRAEFLSAADRNAPAVRPGSSRSGRFRTGRSGRTGRTDPQALFARLDRNRDGKLALTEIPQFLRRQYKPVFDRLRKKELTREEFAAAVRRPQNTADRRRQAEAFFDWLDVNKDGKLTVQESSDRAKRVVESILRRAGKTADGEITKAEYLRIAASQNPGNSKGPFAAAAILRQLDKNRNGAVDKDEAQGPLKENFDRIDSNKNGKLEPAELARLPRGGAPGGKRPAKRKRPKQ